MDIKQGNLTLVLLFTAALLEAGGDAVVRLGLQASTTLARAALFLIGAVVLFAYGYVVNGTSWDFGRLLGVYVVFFFIVAQLISWIVFHQRPSTAILVGGAFIVAGGIIISYP
jgi:drug/metabolite transporter superfamily protein YnfA